MEVFFLFLLALTVGSQTTLYWIPEPDLGRGYFQLNALINLGLLALAIAVYYLHPFQPFGEHSSLGTAGLLVGLVAAFAYYGAIWRERWRTARWPLSLTLAATATALLVAGNELVLTTTPLPHRQLLLFFGLAGSALLLGWSLDTMLLGHWYLISPKLTFRHLVIFCSVLVGIVVFRHLSVAGSLVAAAVVDPMVEPHPWRALVSFGGHGIFFWFRLVWGLLMPLLLALMALHCARQHSNQSATGILYVLVMGSIIGELTALYLTLTTGVPL
jgi:hypothetical protein